jgi:hypothetical protein
MGLIMGSQNNMGLDYGSNISVIPCPDEWRAHQIKRIWESEKSR